MKKNAVLPFAVEVPGRMEEEVEDDSDDEEYGGGTTARCIIHPGSVKRSLWDLFILVLLLVVFLTVPLGLAFGDRFDRHFEIADVVIDSIFLIDVFLNFITGFSPESNDEYIEMRPKAIAKNYLKTWFILDVISCPSVFVALSSDLKSALPAELSILKILKGGKTMKVLKLFKILKMLRIKKMLGNHAILLEEFFMKSSARVHIRLCYLLALVCLSGHLLACVWLLISVKSPRRISWMYAYRDGFDDDGAGSEYQTNDFTEWSMGEQYITAMYFAITTMSTVGFGDICPSSTGERLFMIVAMVVGGGMYGYIIATLTSVVSEMDTNQKVYYEKMDMIHSYMKYRKFPAGLRSRMHQHFRKFFEINSALDEKAIFNDLSESLRLDVMAAISNNSVTMNYLFRGIPASDLGSLSMKLKPFFVEDAFNDVVIAHGDTGNALFLITSGAAKCYRPARSDESPSHDLGVLHCLLVEGDCFGEMVGLGLKPAYNATVVCASEEGLEMLMLTRSDFLSVFPEGSELCNMVRTRARLHSMAPERRKLSLTKARKGAGVNGSGIEIASSSPVRLSSKSKRLSLAARLSFRQSPVPLHKLGFLGSSFDSGGAWREEGANKAEVSDVSDVRSKKAGLQSSGVPSPTPMPQRLSGTDEEAASSGEAKDGRGSFKLTPKTMAVAERGNGAYLRPSFDSGTSASTTTAMLAQVLLELSEIRKQADARARRHEEAIASLASQVSELQEHQRSQSALSL